MKKMMVCCWLVIAGLACQKQESGTNTTPDPDPTGTGSSAMGKGEPGVVGLAGVTAWDNVAAAEKERIKGWNALFLHQSVGQDLEEGCKANGFAFDYYGPNDKTNGAAGGKGLKGGIFVDVGGIPNGNPTEKIRVFRENATRNKDLLQIAIFKFGYADVNDDNVERVKTEYKAMVDALRAQSPILRFVHVTPPLVYSTSAYEGNAAKQKLGQWMKDTFRGTDVIFDLQELESNNGQCQQNNVWRICPENRNTAGDPSDVNGIDTSDGQGHIGKKAGQRIGKALLMSIYRAGK
ncbi:hypothetical protein [Arsenicibacter rosenii]|uniref:SGNH hydrolase-type esterase domain-containing protein n=1 Tax=Arsenicibacter rosenii TaxID=1750698 RepID=A0A1S2VBK1_9BACT|nr:hypothetical protein [Arsenicibacter rosenii]OIN56083.1 hypothetical protein BLX24_26870 [Arsenicibacter rosenii]